MRVSTDADAEPMVWTAPAAQPMMACVGERSDGVLYACGANFEPDLFALGSSEDAGSWESVWRFAAFNDRETNGPLDCPAGTIQNDTCEDGETWQSLTCDIFMLDFPECEQPEPDAGTVIIDPEEPGGCCRVGGGGLPPGSLGAAVLIALWLVIGGRRRRPDR